MHQETTRGQDEPAATKPALGATTRRLSEYFGGQILIKIIYVFGIIFATRAAGPEGWGLITAAISAGFILVTGINLGLNPYVTREIAAGSVSIGRMIRAAARYRLLSSLIFLIVTPTLLIATISDIQMAVLVALTAYLLTDSWAKYLFAMLRGAENTRFEVLGANVEKGTFMLLAVAALGVGDRSGFGGAELVAVAFAVAAFVKFVIALRGTSALGFVSIPARYFIASFSNLRLWWRDSRYLRDSADFLFMALFSTVYFRVDSYMLAVLMGNEEAGYYGAAYRLIEGLLFAPESVLIVFTPLLVRALRSSGDHLGATAIADPETVRQVSALQVAVAGPVATGLMLEAAWLIDKMYGASFEPSTQILFWISPAFIFMSVNFLAGGLLTASYMQRSLLVISGVAAIGNVLLNLWMIPAFGAMGAVASTVATEGAVGAAMLYRITRRVQGSLIWRPALAALAYLFALVVLPNFILHDHLPFLGRLAVGVLSTGAFLTVLTNRGLIPDLRRIR